MASSQLHSPCIQCINSLAKIFSRRYDTFGVKIAGPKSAISISRVDLSTPRSSSQCSIGSCGKSMTGLPIFRIQNSLGKRHMELVVNASNVGTGATLETDTRLGSCLVFPPSNGRKPHAIIKFLGGAFIGAIPNVTYGLLIELLAREGFLVVAVPYNVTFDHEKAAKEVYKKFNACLDLLYTAGLPHANLLSSDLLELPVYSVGHSNGALLQLLSGSYFANRIPKANVVISYNNRPASEAVPYFDQLGPLITQLTPIMEASPMYAMARTTSEDALKTLFNSAASVIQEYNPEAVISVAKFVEQLPLVMNQVYEGVSEFKPTPQENRNFLKNSYNVPQTLLVKFDSDTIDETDTIEEMLRPRVNSIGGKLEKILLGGNHITPCAQDIKWQVGDQYTPTDALAQGLKSASLNDTRELARMVSDWLRGFYRS